MVNDVHKFVFSVKEKRVRHLFCESKNTGFTLVELVVVLGIIVLFTAIAFMNSGSARENFRLDSEMQEMLFSVREAQVYGTSVLEAAGGSFDNAYGVYFDVNNAYYVVFVDLGGTAEKYDPGEEVEIINLPNGFTVSNIYAPEGSSTERSRVNITFKRPNPDATILPDNASSSRSSARIVVTNNTGETRDLIVEDTGQMYIE